MKIEIENLKAQMIGRELNIYQKADALIEFNKLIDYVNELEQLNIDGVSVSFTDSERAKFEEKMSVRSDLVKWSGYKEDNPFINSFKDEEENDLFNSTHELIKRFVFKTRNEVVLANAIFLNMDEINGDKEFIELFKFTCRIIGLNSEWS